MTLKELRESKGLTQEQAADAAKLSQTTISHLEIGRLTNPTLSTISGLAKAFGCSTDEITSAIAETLEAA